MGRQDEIKIVHQQHLCSRSDFSGTDYKTRVRVSYIPAAGREVTDGDELRIKDAC